MHEQRRQFWSLAFSHMMAIWTWFEPTAIRLVVWDEALADLSVDELMRGISYVIRNHSGSQPPTPGEVRDAVRGELVKCAVKDIAGRVVRWERQRLKPTRLPPPMNLDRLRELPRGAHRSTLKNGHDEEDEE